VVVALAPITRGSRREVLAIRLLRPYVVGSACFAFEKEDFLANRASADEVHAMSLA